jgi:hypothetical protein
VKNIEQNYAVFTIKLDGSSCVETSSIQTFSIIFKKSRIFLSSSLGRTGYKSYSIELAFSAKSLRSSRERSSHMRSN